MYIKFGYDSGYTLIFSAFQENGIGRGIEQQPLPEIRPKGLYVATPITDLESGDVALAYVLENLYWEDDLVFILTEDFLYWEGDRVHWEGEWLTSSDDIISEAITWIGDPVGSGEYLPEISAVASGIETNIDLIIANQQMVKNVYDETFKVKEIVVIKNL